MMYRPISRICLSVSLWTTALIITIALVVGGLALLENIIQMQNSEYKRLTIIAPLLISALSGELVMEDERAITAIKNEFQNKYNLTNISISKEKNVCPQSNFIKNWEHSCWYGEIPELRPKYYLMITTSGNKLEANVVKNFLFQTLLPLIILGLLIAFIINNKLKKAIVLPIVTLADNPETWKATNDSIAKEVADVHQKLIKFINERDIEFVRAEALKVEASLGKLASQLAHDIRSPLVSLDKAINYIKNVPEKQRIIIRSSISRIRDIANNLLKKYNNIDEEIQKLSEPVADLILSVISEKKLQYQTHSFEVNTNFDEWAYTGFINASLYDFKRVISNLLDNAIEAFNKETKFINLHLFMDENNIYIVIQDNGCGMSSEMVDNINAGIVNSNKVNGHGLGVSYALKMVREIWKGDFLVKSVIEKGTTINLTLPKTDLPRWFASKIVIPADYTIIIVDDDESIHQIWNDRFRENKITNSSLNFYRTQDFIHWHQDHQVDNFLYLLDYELIDSDRTGLDLIEQLNLKKHTYLVTSHYDEPDIRKRSEELKIPIIPKSFSPYICIELLNEINSTDCIIIDDNKFLTDMWILHGEKVGKNVTAFNKTNDFRLVMANTKKSIPIYVDHELNDEVSGLEFTKELYESGFTEIYLATGYHTNDFKKMPWINAIVDKEPPF